MKFTYGEKQKVNNVDLDRLFTALQSVLREHPLISEENINALVSEWINDLLFLTGKITEEELQETIKTLDSSNDDASESSEET